MHKDKLTHSENLCEKLGITHKWAKQGKTELSENKAAPFLSRTVFKASSICHEGNIRMLKQCK